eukprot:scaffold36422_cov53-Attheya_sp.AAC.2
MSYVQVCVSSPNGTIIVQYQQVYRAAAGEPPTWHQYLAGMSLLTHVETCLVLIAALTTASEQLFPACCFNSLLKYFYYLSHVPAVAALGPSELKYDEIGYLPAAAGATTYVRIMFNRRGIVVMHVSQKLT